ncbi:MAG: hypothetical protein ACOYNS_05100 [Bacteroidota bacterium]
MKSIFTIAIILSLSLIGCKENSQTTNVTGQNTSGRVLFSFDKANAPIDVKILTATLSRSNFTSKQKIVNIQQDTGNIMMFDQVEVGTWSIQVEAKNDSGKILYAGKSEVTVYENFVSQINLVLAPVISGVGTVQINITWNNNVVTWKDSPNNPILVRTGGNIDWGGVGQPKILYDNGIYRMYFLDYSFPSPVSYAESQDGLKWYRIDSLPILKAGQIGSWDDGGVGPGPVFKNEDKYYMLYQGYDASSKHFRIGLAMSINGKTWTKFPNPVLSDSLNWEGNLVASDVKFINNKFYMYYCTNGNIGLATSLDGVKWTRYSSNPILSPTQVWETGNITFPSVMKINEKYFMVYMNNGSNSSIAFGMAESNDGIIWTKQSTNPFFNKKLTDKNWALNGILYPYATNILGKIRIYYTGICENNEWKIGFLYQ